MHRAGRQRRFPLRLGRSRLVGAAAKERCMARRIVDISIPLANDIPADPPIQKVSITYVDHKQSLPGLLGFFPGLKADDLPDGEAWAIEQVALTTHNGTHLDAPWHY